MLKPSDFYTKRDYSIYLVAKGLDLVLYAIALLILVVPSVVGIVAEWCVDGASALCSSVHATRRSVTTAVADRLSRFVAPADELPSNAPTSPGRAQDDGQAPATIVAAPVHGLVGPTTLPPDTTTGAAP